MPIENTKMCAARSEDNKIPPNIICLPDTRLQVMHGIYKRRVLTPCDFLFQNIKIKYIGPSDGYLIFIIFSL